MPANLFSVRYIQTAERIFLRPTKTYTWDDIILGIKVQTQNGRTKKMWAVAPNTFRGFYRIQKTCPGAQDEFRNYFIQHKTRLLASLTKVSTRSALDRLEDSICEAMRPRLQNIKQDMLASYNKIRKPIDLYFEHLIAMASELAPVREKLVPLLNVPIDHQIIGHPCIFSEEELGTHRLSRASTYGSVTEQSTYSDLQKQIRDKAQRLTLDLGKAFHPIYFDLVWNGRFKSSGTNLFATNPG